MAGAPRGNGPAPAPEEMDVACIVRIWESKKDDFGVAVVFEESQSGLVRSRSGGIGMMD